MNEKNIDFDALKKRGFLKEKEEGYFTLRTRGPSGNYTQKHLAGLAKISEEYARGFVHLTVRQGIEIPFIRFEDIPKVEEEVKCLGVKLGTSGPRLRATTACPGNNWCKRGLVNTFALFERIEKERGIGCGLNLPHKFKIVISGCPNACTRVQMSEIGLHGAIDTEGSEKKVGYVIYLAGCGGKTPRLGFKLKPVFTEEQTLALIENVVDFYRKRARPKQRLALLIEEIGRDNFLQQIGISQ
ncbi:MAG: hypothetical protein ABIE75_02515 [Candidatus Omnitrophota bacterium]